MVAATRIAGLFALALLAAGCADEMATSATKLGTTRQKIVGGTTSVAAQDAAVMVGLGTPEQGACTGSLIAPNVVLTARHCVAAPSDPAKECSTFNTTTDPSSFSIHLGVNALPGGLPAARVKKITVSNTSNMCSHDVAVLELDRDLNYKVATLRFTELTANETTTAVGYGVGGQNEARPTRMQRTTNVIAVGPKKIQFTTKANAIIDYDVPTGDIATGESTCYGDSGGPLFDSQGRVVGITSRGLINFPQTGAHGNGCIDLPSVFASVRFNEQTIREAMRIAGHPIETATDTQESTDDEDDLDTQSDGEGGNGDEIFESSSSKRRRTSSSEDTAIASQGCSMTTTPSSSSATIVGLVALLACVLKRSRNRN